MSTILWFPQLSSVTPEGKFKLDGDSNWAFARNIIGALSKYSNEDLRFIIAIPAPKDIVGHTMKKKMAGMLGIPGLSTVTIPMPPKAEAGRFTFFYQKIKDMFINLLADKVSLKAVWINEPCHVMNFKFVLNELGLLGKVPVISYNHWLDNNMFPKIDIYERRVSYTMRQIEAAIESDIHYLNSNYAVTMLEESFKQYGIPFNEFGKNVKVLPPSVLDSELYSGIPKRGPDWHKATIIYNHRLSSFGYYQDALNYFLAVMDNLYKKYSDRFDVIFTNPSGKDVTINRPYARLMTDLPYIDYIRLLGRADACVGTFRPGDGGMWSMSLVDAIAVGTPTFIPNHSGYKELVTVDYPYLYSNSLELFDGLSKIIELKQSVEEARYIAAERELILDRLSAKSIALMIMDDIKEAVNNVSNS